MSDSRAAASRQNGAKSAGPVSAEGRERSSQKALKLGVYSQRPLLGDESEADFKELLAQLTEDFQPVGVVETEYVYEIAIIIWRKRRLCRAETAAIERDRSQFHFDLDMSKWGDLSSALVLQNRSIPDEARPKLEAERDRQAIAFRSIPRDDERFTRVGVALERQFERALKGLREAQSVRRSAIEGVLVNPPGKPRRASVKSDTNVVDIDSEPIADH